MERQAEGPLSFYQRFLRITFRTFRCSCAHTTHTRTHVNVHTYIHMHHPRSLSFLSSPSSPSIPRPILLCRSPSPHRFTAFVLLVTIVHMCTCVCVCTCIRASSQSSREVSCRAALRSRGERAALYVGERENVF